MSTRIKDSVKSTSPAPITKNDLPEINATPAPSALEVFQAARLAYESAQKNAQILIDEQIKLREVKFAAIAAIQTEIDQIEATLVSLGSPVKSGRGRPPMTAEQKSQAAKDRAEATALLAAKKAASAAAMAGGAVNNSGAVISNTPAAVNAGA